MDEGREEKVGERMIQSELEKLGLYVRHIDCNIDGFPDLIVIGHEIVLVEFKYITGNKKISTVFEPSQPVFYHEMHKVNFFRTMICAFDGELFRTRCIGDILKQSMDGWHVEDILGYTTSLSASRTARGIAFMTGMVLQ